MSIKTFVAGITAARPADFDDYRDEVIASIRRSGHAKAFSLTITHASHAAAEACLAEVSTPTLVIMGEQDPGFPPISGLRPTGSPRPSTVRSSWSPTRGTTPVATGRSRHPRRRALRRIGPLPCLEPEAPTRIST